MQKWRGGSDTTAPLLTLTEFTDGERIGWNIASDEPIFQPAPSLHWKTAMNNILFFRARE